MFCVALDRSSRQARIGAANRRFRRLPTSQKSCAKPSTALRTPAVEKENHRQLLTLPKLNRDSFGAAIRALHRFCGKHCRKSCEKRPKLKTRAPSKQNAQARVRMRQLAQNMRLGKFHGVCCIATCALFCFGCHFPQRESKFAVTPSIVFTPNLRGFAQS